jgi:hypothetical protein
VKLDARYFAMCKLEEAERRRRERDRETPELRLSTEKNIPEPWNRVRCIHWMPPLAHRPEHEEPK